MNKENGISKSCGRSKSPKNSKERCWKYGKFDHFKIDCKEEKKENKKKNNDSNDEYKKYSQ